MDIVKSITGIKRKVTRKLAARKAQKTKEAKDLKALRSKYIPIIRRIARKYHAMVEPLDRTAYVYVTKDGRERGVHIPYGTPVGEISILIEKKLYSSSTIHQITKGVVVTARELKRARDDLKKAGFGGSSMYGDPSKLYRR